MRLPRFTKNFFFLLGVVFIGWMLFFDSNDLYNQLKLTGKKQNLEGQKVYYSNKIEEVQKDREELFSDPELLEKFARERYLMKKPTEDIYIIVKEE